MEKLGQKYLFINKYIRYADNYKLLFYVMFIIISFLCFHFSYRYFYEKFSRDFDNIEADRNCKYIKLFSRAGKLTFIIGGISFLIFISGFGGLSQIISISELNRSFEVTLSQFGSYWISLFSIPARIITVTPYIYLYLILNRKRATDKLIFTCSFFLSMVYYLFYAGRAPLIIFLMSFIYFFIKRFFKYAWSILIFIGILFLPLLDYLENFFFYLSYGIWIDKNIEYISYIYEFSFPYNVALNVTDIVANFGYSYGKEFITTFINFIPGINFTKTYELTSEFFSGMNWRTVGGVPNDFISFGYLQFSTVGIIVLSVIVGLIFAKIDIGLTLLSKNKAGYLISSIVATNTFILIRTFDFGPIVRGGFILIVMGILIFKIVNMEKRKSQHQNNISSNLK